MYYEFDNRGSEMPLSLSINSSPNVDVLRPLRHDCERGQRSQSGGPEFGFCLSVHPGRPCLRNL